MTGVTGWSQSDTGSGVGWKLWVVPQFGPVLGGVLWGILRRGILLQPRGLLEASKYTAARKGHYACFWMFLEMLCVKSKSRFVHFSGQLLLVQSIHIQICYHSG